MTVLSSIRSHATNRLAGVLAGAFITIAGLSGLGTTSAAAQTIPAPSPDLTIVSATDTTPIPPAFCGQSNFKARLTGTVLLPTRAES